MAHNSEYDLPDVWNVPEPIEKPPSNWSRYHRYFFKLRNVLHEPKRESKPEPITILDLILKGRPGIDAVTLTEAYKADVNFQEQDPDLVVLEDPIGLTRVLPNGRIETYPEELNNPRL